MSVSSIDAKIAPLSRRFSDSSATPADLFQVVAWSVLTIVLLGYAVADGSLGALVLGALTLTQVRGAWTGAVSRDETAPDRLAPPQQL